MVTRPLLLFAGALTLVLSTTLPAPADAVTVDRRLWFPAAGVCEATLPEIDASLRRRAKDLRNVEPGAMSVSCGLVTDNFPVSGSLGQIALHATNNRVATASMSCTLTAGTSQEAQIASKQTLTLAGGASGVIRWNATHYGSSRQHGNITCILPGGWGINALSAFYLEDVGL